jgi:putative transcriptional regulator
MDFFRYRNKIDLDKGRLLLSEPYLPDPNFERTVILLTEHNDDGSVGFVLNKPSESKVSEVMEELSKFEFPIYIGGPVQQDTLHYVHRCRELKDAIAVQETGQISATEIRFFLGYSGWSPGQLAEELKLDSWIVSDRVSEELIFETLPDQMWKSALKSLGGRFTIYSNYPNDPRMN